MTSLGRITAWKSFVLPLVALASLTWSSRCWNPSETPSKSLFSGSDAVAEGKGDFVASCCVASSCTGSFGFCSGCTIFYCSCIGWSWLQKASADASYYLKKSSSSSYIYWLVAITLKSTSTISNLPSLSTFYGGGTTAEKSRACGRMRAGGGCFRFWSGPIHWGRFSSVFGEIVISADFTETRGTGDEFWAISPLLFGNLGDLKPLGLPKLFW